MPNFTNRTLRKVIEGKKEQIKKKHLYPFFRTLF